jgi:4-amino-4-deoxy-L-arabinose transferase-like glycosyltransferase
MTRDTPESSPSDPADDSPFRLLDLPTLGPGAKRIWAGRLMVMLAAAAVLIPLAGSFGLWDPWETHYGEVARQITERNDWISTWWGSHWEDAAGDSEGSYFFSKPILLMWLMAIGLEIFGFSEWGIRLGVALIAIVGLGAVYAMGASIFRRRTGLLMAAVLGTSPFWFFLGRQAQTDMPFVGLMTIGLCAFMMAIFGRDRHEPADRLGYGLATGFFGLVTIPQAWLVLVGLARWRGGENAVMGWMTQSVSLGLSIGGIPIALGGCLLAASLWTGRHEGDKERDSRRRLAQYGLGAVWIPQALILIAAVVGALVVGTNPARALEGWWVWGPTQSSLYATCFGAALYLFLARPDPTRRSMRLLTFYVFIALATLAKGLLGFLLPGAVLFFYILLTREWPLLKRVALVPGTLAFVAVGFPWYAAMLIRHTRGFWQRFFVHDHFKRLASGVHSIDDGSFEHFIRWLGYGLFPWSALVPAALGRLFAGRGLEIEEDRGRATLMLLLWTIIAFTLFTLSSTKFHHYIFPAVPPLALLVALTVDDLLDREVPEPWPLYLIGAGIFALLAWDLIHDPQLLKDLFTYKYDREWNGEAWNSTFRTWLTLLSIPGGLGMLWLVARARAVRRAAVGLVFVTGLGMAVFGLDVYMPTISSTWSQKGVWDAYYQLCTRLEEDEEPPGADPKKRFCEEEAIAYKLNWRGETYYTQNEVIPLRDDEDWDHFVKEQGNEPFYGIMQRSRYQGAFKRALPNRWEGKSCMLYDGNIKFALVKVPCTEADKRRARKLGLLGNEDAK